MKNRGFSLIETLVGIVLVILLIVLLVGIYANQTKEATLKANINKVADQIRMISDAEEFFYTKNLTWATRENLLEKGILKSWPIPPVEIADKTCMQNEGMAKFEYQLWIEDIADGTKKDFIVALPCVTEEFAIKYNESKLNGSIGTNGTTTTP